MYWISFCSEERPILTMVGFFVSQAKRRGWTTSSVDAKTARVRERGRRYMHVHVHMHAFK